MMMNDLEDFIYLNNPEPAMPNTRGINDTKLLHQSYGMPNEMQLIKLMGHLIMKCKEL